MKREQIVTLAQLKEVTKKELRDSVLLRRQVKKVAAEGKFLPQTPGPQSHNPGPPENLANALTLVW
jgi:hypothetical protein